MKITLDDIITVLCGIGIAAAVFLLIGTAGAIETDGLTFKEGAIRCAIYLVVLVVSVFGLTKMESEENVYDKL